MPARQQMSLPNDASLLNGADLNKDSVRELVRLVKVGLDAEESCLGFHGTAVHGLLKAACTPDASFATGRSENNEGALYFYPTRPEDYRSLPGFTPRYTSAGEAYAGAVSYADDLTRTYQILHMLKLDPENAAHWKLASMTFDSALEGEIVLKNHPEILGISVRQLDQANLIISRRSVERGFVLLLDKKIVDDFPVTAGDPHYGDLKVVCPNGFPFSHVAGIVPSSDTDEDFVRMLARAAGVPEPD